MPDQTPESYVVDTAGLPDGYVTPSASLTLPASSDGPCGHRHHEPYRADGRTVLSAQDEHLAVACCTGAAEDFADAVNRLDDLTGELNDVTHWLQRHGVEVKKVDGAWDLPGALRELAARPPAPTVSDSKSEGRDRDALTVEVHALLDLWGTDRRLDAAGRRGVRRAWPEVGQRLDDLLETRDAAPDASAVAAGIAAPGEVEVVGVVPPRDFEPPAEGGVDELLLVRLDGRKSGRVTIGHSRLPAATIVGELAAGTDHERITAGWPGATPEVLRVLARLVDDLGLRATEPCKDCGQLLGPEDDPWHTCHLDQHMAAVAPAEAALVEVAVEALEASRRRLLHAQGLIGTEIGRVSLALRRAHGAVVPPTG